MIMLNWSKRANHGMEFHYATTICGIILFDIHVNLEYKEICLYSNLPGIINEVEYGNIENAKSDAEKYFKGWIDKMGLEFKKG